jgi:hypothetical protein
LPGRTSEQEGCGAACEVANLGPFGQPFGVGRATRTESLCQGSNLDNGLRKPVPESVRTERGRGRSGRPPVSNAGKEEKMGVPGEI